MAFNIKELFIPADEYDEEVIDQAGSDNMENADVKEPVNRSKKVQRNVISMDGNRSAPSKIALYEPRTYADAQTIATQILQGEAVIVNFGGIDERNQLRVLDYIAGAAFAVDGMVERVGEKIFLATPHNFEITGSISQNQGL